MSVNSSTGAITYGGQNVGTVSFNSTTNKLTFNFNIDNLNESITNIEYNSFLNNNASIGEENPNETSVKMQYANDPYGSGTTFFSGQGAFIHTYGLKILKKNSSNTPLPGAQIKLCRDSACNTQIGTTQTTDVNGYVTFDGVSSGTYYYQELKAPNGYRLDSTIYSVSVNSGDLDEYGYKIVNLVNIPLGVLPATGGIGTYIYTGVGLTLMIGAIVILLVKNKKKK